LESGQWNPDDRDAEFQGRADDTQLWQVALLVTNADKLPDSVKKELAPEPPPAAMPPAAAPGKASPAKKK